MKEKNNSKDRKTLESESVQTVEKKTFFEKVLDISIVVLLVLIVVLGLRILKNGDFLGNARTYVDRIKLDFLKKKEEGVVDKQVVQSTRVYPEFLSDEEKEALKPQSEVKSTDEMRRWAELTKKIAINSEKLDLRTVNGDCFGYPVVLKLNDGKKVQVTNENEKEVFLGLGEKRWDIPAKGSLIVDFSEIISENAIFGYGCGNSNEPSGLILVEL